MSGITKAAIFRNLENTKVAFEAKILGVESRRILKFMESLGKGRIQSKKKKMSGNFQTSV